jgi:hypothetical protein
MKKIVFLLVLMFVTVTSAFAWDVDTAAKEYLDDEVVLGLRVTPATNQDAAFVRGYCGAIADELSSDYGSNQPVLFEMGFQNQDKLTYSAACRSLLKVCDRITADDGRAILYIVGSLMEEDAVNKKEVPLRNSLYIVNRFHTSTDNFGPVSMIRTLINLSELHPKGLPVKAKEFYKNLFLGRVDAAMKVLESARPGQQLKDTIAKNIVQ